MKPAGDDNSVI